MSSILNPFSSIVTPGNYQVPNGQLEIDWTQSITSGLIGCYLPGTVMGFVDVTGLSPTVGIASGSPGGPLQSLSNDGPGLNFTATGANPSNLAASPAPSSYLTPSEFSLFWRGLILQTTGLSAFAEFLGINYQYPTNVAPFNLWTFGVDNTGGPGLQIAWNAGGTQFAWNSGTGGAPLTQTLSLGMHSYGVTFKVGGNVLFYLDGPSPQTISFGASQPTFSASTGLLIGGDKGVVTNIGCFWNRALTAAEMLQMHLAPYDFLIPAEYDLPVAIFVAPQVFTLMPQIVM